MRITKEELVQGLRNVAKYVDMIEKQPPSELSRLMKEKFPNFIPESDGEARATLIKWYIAEVFGKYDHRI